MKHTTKLIVATGLVLSLVVAAALTGCGARSTSYVSSSSSMAATNYDTSAMEEKGMPSAAPQMANRSTGEAASFASKQVSSTSPTNTAAPIDQPRKLVKNSQLTLETKEFDNALDSIIKMVEDAGGYVDNQSVNGASLRDNRDYYERSASITVRIPADKLDSFTTQAGELCNIVAHSEGVNDITDSYYDAQSRLDVLRVKETRLTELLAKAEKLEDIIQLEDALSTCQYEIDSLSGQLRRMDSLVSYSTCNITLDEVVEYSDIQVKPKSFGERLAESARYSWRNLSNSVQNTIINLVEAGPVTIFYLLLWGGFFYLVYRLVIRKHLRSRNAPKVSDPAPVIVEDNTDSE